MTPTLSDLVSVYKRGSNYALNKPLLLLIALDNCLHDRPRLLNFAFYENLHTQLFGKIDQSQLIYPFGRLVNDGIWEVEDFIHLRKTASGDLYASEVKEKDIKAGFEERIYKTLGSNKESIFIEMNMIIDKYIPQEHHSMVRNKLNLEIQKASLIQDSTITESYTGQKINLPRQEKLTMHKSEYISYLNSLHNASASNTNALAESQALHHYFAEIYQAFPIAEPLYDNLVGNEDCVVILTGHAGDGKSTIALDLLKRLRGIPPQDTLNKPLSEKEVGSLPNGKSIHIVKDMSELEKVKRLKWLEQGFSEPGSWLIVSNTGPMLTSLSDYTPDKVSVEDAVLSALDNVYDDGSFKSSTIHSFGDYQLEKPLIIINVARLDNTALGSSLLQKMLTHSGWDECNTCSILDRCPLQKNRQALLESPNTINRVRWIYQKLTDYEQRLTLRQMVGHLALSLTGNTSCEQAHSNTSSLSSGSSLGRILFSETFFGYCAGKKTGLIVGVKAAELLQRMELGGSVSADFERQLTRELDQRSYSLPITLKELDLFWVSKAQKTQDGINLRHSLRRMAYIYGDSPKDKRQESNFGNFLDKFIQSPSLRKLDKWKAGGWDKLNYSERKQDKRKILGVLLEIYSGFSAIQFNDRDYLYLTLSRKDRSISQTTQLVVAEIPYDDFSVEFDDKSNLPKLVFLPNKDLFLLLKLPLLDFISEKSTGNLGTDLSPIHIAHLEWFRSSLLSVIESKNDKVVFLKSSVDGLVDTKKFYIDDSRSILEKA